MDNKVVIIDYGFGNILSVKQGFQKIGANVIVSSNIKIIETATHIVLPGVGAFENAMKALYQLNLIDVVINIANKGIPLLGICLGMQMLLNESDEFGVTKGLGLIPGRVEKFPLSILDHEPIKVPQINWHELVTSQSNNNWKNTILRNHKQNEAVYFVHSFVANPTDEKHKLAEYICGGNRITAVIQKDNIWGCQFHPEKSGTSGLNVLYNFILL
ncbi:imidazole glycerol phosphate synthase subunit HisH [Candidatus Thioglobus sp.]|nr:imidazole glycerol phosphate synthase subunit HisH [Candidatus Thioglobus sp.]